jgi:serine beta-lactamase-like protein LACTB
MGSSGHSERLLAIAAAEKYSLAPMNRALFPWIHVASAVALWLVFAIAAGAKSQQEMVEDIRGRMMTNWAPKMAGLSVAVGQEDKIVWAEGFGFADIAAKKPVTAVTRFRIGSVSKSITAVGLMLLVQQGKLDLDADIHKYVTDYPDKGVVITTRELAGHLAGIRHYSGLEFFLNKPFATVRGSLKIFEDDPLLSKPGEKYSYSSYGYNLISAVMEQAAKEEFLGYMERAVFGPLKLTNTGPDRAGVVMPERTKFYVAKTGGGFNDAPPVDNSYKWASGGFLSTPSDLVRLGEALLKPGFLEADSLKAMFTAQKTTDGKPTTYGIGWEVRHDGAGHRVWMHTGGSVGGTSVLMLYPDSGYVLAITANCSGAPFDKTDMKAMVEELGATIGKGE